MSRVAGCVKLLALGLLQTGAGCNCNGEQTIDASADVKTEKPLVDGPTDATDGAVDGPSVACSVPGYLIDKDYDPNCGFCYASSVAFLPKPIAWQPCNADSTPAAMICRQMVEDWDYGQFFDYISAAVPAWVQPDQTVTIMLGRMEWPNIYRVVADADGMVRQAIVETNNQVCTLGLDDVRDGRAAYRVYDTEAQGKLSEFGGGALGGDINALHPHVYAHYHGFDQDVRTYYASALGLFEGGSNGFYVNQYDWTTGTLVRTLDSATLDNGFGIAHVWPRTNAVFWDAYSGLTYNKIRVWTESDGTSDLISVPNDPTRAASNFGTDEVKIVWQRGSGRIDGGSTFPINDVMVANYATTGAALTGTRLRSDGTEFSTSPFVVGCGYAAHFSNLVPAQVGLLLLRLSDGQAWTLTSTNTASWIWTAPIALTCTELFAIVEAKGDSGKAHTTIARVRLDSLGSGIPPD